MTNDEAVERVKARGARLKALARDWLADGWTDSVEGKDAIAIQHLLSRYERMEKALEFYGDAGNYEDFIARPPGRDSHFHSAHVKLDKGLRARQALGASE